MCYSSQIQAEFRRFEREYGASISIERFVELFWHQRRTGGWQRIPRALRKAFAESAESNAAIVSDGDKEQANRFEAEIFQQRGRLAEAERTLATRSTKKAEADRRIATDKIARAQQNLADLQHSGLGDQDRRVFPGYYAPVIISQGGRRVVVPMRYQCRLPGWTEVDERKRPGTYNARRDNLERAWRALFGHRHGVMVITAFYEHVPRHKAERRALLPGEAEESVILAFQPRPPQDMLVACLWSVSPGGEGEQDLYSFAAITDEPPPEVAAAGHDRCIIPLRPEHVDAWLNPEAADLAAMQAILDDREPLYFDCKLAA
ncbi:SOS response-associated peptidase family protein [Cupriavidus numazuensis]|uniref:Abasic site processing protein n=1 Tax=Cupriavidus numazuensis TaxID=221992 RepID=A0ABM8TEU4_9BURK|nr:SOS response-associated peptidase family protein [Cupriavidus numazuensis]CAG2140463.1 hypothetical protein LMG26411_01878 [Cupriavidus numazuensis]